MRGRNTGMGRIKIRPSEMVRGGFSISFVFDPNPE